MALKNEMPQPVDVFAKGSLEFQDGCFQFAFIRCNNPGTQVTDTVF